MKRLLTTLLCVFFGLLCQRAGAMNDDTADEARALVDKAAALMRVLGPDRALAEISNPNGAFHYRDMYVSVFTLRGRIAAHGALPQLVGRSAWDWRDADDMYYVREIITRAQRGDTGPIEYTRIHPRTRQLRAKSTWFRLVDDYVIACGAFK